MTSPETTRRPNRALRVAVERAADRPYYLAYALRRYREGAGMTEAQLAEFLQCDPAEMASLALCRRPGEAGMDMAGDLTYLAHRYHLQPARLAELLEYVFGDED